VFGTLSNCYLLYKVAYSCNMQARFGGQSDIKATLQNSSDICLLKIIKIRMAYGKLVAHSKRATFLNNVNTGKGIITFTRYCISTLNRCGGQTCTLLLQISSGMLLPKIIEIG